MNEYDSEGDSSDVACPWDGCEYTSNTEGGVKRPHKLAHGESIAGVVVECAWCGESKRVPPALERRSERHFCDTECYGEWQSENCRGEESRRWEGGKATIRCTHCGEESPMWDHRVGQNDRQFCNDDCYKAWRSEHKVGENHPSWAGGQFPYGEGWTEALKERVREQQERRCANCGVHTSEFDRKLDVHHIHKARALDDDDARNDESNLVALCRSCHSQWEQMAPLRPQTPHFD